MASKRLGRLRQWAGEVISSKDKTVVTEEFKELETDIELRRKGILKIQQASTNYHHFLSKKKDLDFLPEESEKLAPRDALGIVMVAHGEEFGEDSAFGTSLVKLGQGMLKTAALQETQALTLQGTFLTSLQVYLDEIKQYQELRKKLESRRLSYDAALNKVERSKNSKKEKDRQEADDELEAAKSKYEDVLDDVQIKMQAIQESEIDQLRELTGFLDIELRFAESYLDVMKQIKADWVESSLLVRVNKGTPRHTSQSVGQDLKFNPVQARKSTKSKMVDSSEDEGPSTVRTSSKSTTRRKSEAEPPSHRPSRPSSRPPSRPPSRPSSRASRKRSDSTTTVGEKDKVERQRGLSMSWASNAVNNMTGRGKKDKENFIGLDDTNDTDDREHEFSTLSKNKSNSLSTPTRPPRSLLSTSSHSSLRDKKMAKAVEDFSGSSDELSFKVGDEITVLNEVTDGWWMGELDGKKGLFPISHTEFILTRTSSAPSVPQSSNRWRLSFGGTSLQENDASKKTLFGDDEELTSATLTSDDDDYVFGDHNFVDHNRSPVYGMFNPAVENITDDEDHLLQQSSSELDPAHKVPFGKKPPPPPPPRRTPMSSSASIPPPLPDRNPPPLSNRSKSSPTVLKGASFVRSDTSPFDSPVGSSFPSVEARNPF